MKTINLCQAVSAAAPEAPSASRTSYPVARQHLHTAEKLQKRNKEVSFLFILRRLTLQSIFPEGAPPQHKKKERFSLPRDPLSSRWQKLDLLAGKDVRNLPRQKRGYDTIVNFRIMTSCCMQVCNQGEWVVYAMYTTLP